jgi:hypothetical protein
VPAGVEPEVTTFSVEEPPTVTALGLSVTVVPAGWPVSLKDTVCVFEPLTRAVLIVDVAELPRLTDRLLGLAESEKSLSDDPLTVSVTDVVCDPLVAVPVTVTV